MPEIVSAVAPIGRQLGYLFRYRSHIDELRHAVQKLEAARVDLQITVDEAMRRGDEIRPIVQDWLNRVDDVTGEAEELLMKEDENNNKMMMISCFNLKSRYGLGREAYKKAQVIVAIQTARNFPDGVSYYVPPPQTVPFKQPECFESRVLTLNEIMNALRDDDEMKIIGVWGVGGVGKTTFIKQVAEQAKQEKLFTTQVYINVSWTRGEGHRIQQGIWSIQQRIADTIGLELEEATTIPARAGELKQSLMKEKVLIVLDDIWKGVSLEEVGIPSKGDLIKDCGKIVVLLASRHTNLLIHDMGAEICFPLQSLSPEEALSLIMKTAGDSAFTENPELSSIVMQVIRECVGLPIALVTIAVALKGEGLSEWRHAWEELRRSRSAPLSRIHEDNVYYSCVEWSYNHLKDKDAQFLFLICGLLGDGHISMDDLSKYVIGLDSFDYMFNYDLESVRNKVVNLVKILQASNMLHDAVIDEDLQIFGEPLILYFLEEEGNEFVRMHDVIRDCARSIASKDPYRFLVKDEASILQESENRGGELSINCTCLSLECTGVQMLPEGLVCPKLEFLILNSNDSSLRIPKSFLEGMEKLTVLEVSNMSLTPLPLSFFFLENLLTLCLDHCQLDDISIIGELKSLKVLSLKSSNIKRLPKEMMQLSDLRWLDLRNCSYLDEIPQNVLSSLSRLEYLRMENSFTQWGVVVEGFNGGSESINACISELKRLSHLTALGLKIPNPNSLPLDMLFRNFSRFRILVGDRWTWHHSTCKASRLLKLSEVKTFHLVNCFSGLLERIQHLELKGLDDDGIQVVAHMDRWGFPELKHLHIHDSFWIQYIIKSMDDELVSSHTPFPILEELQLRGLIDLDALCHGPIPAGCFHYLRILSVGRCKNLRHLLVVPTAERREILFPRLGSLSLEDLPNICSFYSTGTHSDDEGSRGISSETMLDAHIPFFNDQQVLLPALEYLCMDKLYNVRTLWRNQISVHSFWNLRSVEVIGCPYLKYIFPASVAKDLLQLELLNIVSCGVEEIVANENGDGAQSMILFPRLASLTLTGLVNLMCFYRGTHSLGWPLLKELKVENCYHLQILALEVDINPISHSLLLVEKFPFPALEVLEIFDMENMEKICQDQLPMLSFGKLKEIRLSNCRNLRCVFPTSVIQGLEQLEILEIGYCGMKEIFAEEDGLETPKRFIFSKLTKLRLKNLKALKSFFGGNYISEWPLLKRLEISNCDNIDILFQEIGSEGNIDDQLQQPCFLVEKLAFPKLEVLEISEIEIMKKIWHGQLSTVESFGNLKHIMISCCRNLSCVFPAAANLSLLQLETLELYSCGIEEIIVKDDGIKTPHAIIFPKLSSLILKNLKELRCFNSRKHISEWPSLKILEMWNCDKIEIIFQEMSLEADLDNLVQQPFFSVEKVAFPRLEDLDISYMDNVEKIWQDGFIAGSFRKLKRLSVRYCQKLENIIPSYMLKRLSSLQILKIKNCDSVEQVFDMEAIDIKENHDIPTLQLRELCLDNLKKLKYVWNKAPEGLLTYQNLNRVKVSLCPSLKNPFPGYVMRSLLQVKEEDMNSCGVKEIVAHEDVAKVVSMFLFPEENSLTNSGLHELKCFYLGLRTLEWPMLKTLEVESHESLKKLACKLDKGVDEKPIFLCDKVTFPNLESLNLSLKLKEIQDLHVLFGALSNLNELTVENCPFLLSLFSPQFIQCLNNLKKLTVKKCDLLEEVFDCEGLGHGDDAEHVEMLSKLEDVNLIDLPNLRYVCNNAPPQVLCFKNLKLLWVKQCNSLTYLFTPSMLLGLVQLVDLRIEHCPTMKEIFPVEGGRDTDNWPRQVSCFKNLKVLQVKECESLMYLFPYSVALGLEQLQDLCIENCIKMEKIIMEDGDEDKYRPQQVSSLQNLKSVQVKQCDSLMYLFSPSMALGLVELQGLCVEDCPMMKEIISTADSRDFDNQSQQISSFQSLISVRVKQCGMLMYLFPSFLALGLVQLQDLSIEHCSNMKEIVKENRDHTSNRPQQVSCLQNLKLVQVKQCDNLMYLFSSSFAVALAQLQHLSIEHCPMMKEIVTAEEGVLAEKIIFPQLTYVSLLNVPKLTTFYPSQNLENIHMRDSNAAPSVLFNEKVAFPKMELLHVSGLNNVKKIWQNEPLADSFSNLKKMKVENCNELQNISTSNVLNWLPSLEFLRIASCGNLQEVFDLEVVNVLEDATDNQLSQLLLDNLQNLKHICHKVLGRKLCVQNLKILEVHECRSMKNLFSPYIEKFKGMGEIIRQEERAEEVIDKIEFPELTSLALKWLPSLESFYPGSHTLRKVGLQDHDILITVLFNEKVAFPSLESLDISGLSRMKKIWHYELIENSFGKLKQVKIENCNELQNGYPSNVLKRSLDLHFLSVVSCNQLEEVFDLEGAGHVLEEATETELNHLVLQDLPQLQYIWNKDPYGILTFQKLDFVEVFRCHGLKSHFPVGSLVRGLPQLEKQLIRSRGTEVFGEEDKGEGFVFPEVTYDKLLYLRKIKSKEVVIEDDDVSEICEDMPGSSG